MQSQVLFPLRSLRKLEVAFPKNKRPRSSSKPFCRPDFSSPPGLIVARRTGSVNLNWDTQPFFVVKFTRLRLNHDSDEPTNHVVKSNAEGRANAGISVTENVQKRHDNDHSQSEPS
jgi:hypothetical protein